MKRSTISLFLILMIALQAWAYKKQSIDITVNGKSRNMVVFTPTSLPANSPLVIVTHGMNQSPEYQYDGDKLYEMIDTAKFVVAYLRSDGNTWDTGGTNDQNFVSKTIDEMFTRFNINKDRVYWSGFSMGSMLIHHCISKMQNKIAAFAPTSGIQFSESPWNSCSKPVNLLECIAYGDDVFGYEQYGIHAYIENYAKHDKHTKYSKTVGYKPASSNWQDGDLEKWTGGTNDGSKPQPHLELCQALHAEPTRGENHCTCRRDNPSLHGSHRRVCLPRHHTDSNSQGYQRTDCEDGIL